MASLGNEDGLDILSHICLKDHTESMARQRLRIRIKLLEKPSEKRLNMLITAEDEVELFYLLEVTEADFRTLRQKQGLLVEIGAFPAMLERLLESCRDDELSDSPKFLAVLIKNKSASDSATFEIQEINTYRRLVHLSLEFCRGTDSKIREYLGERLKRSHLECEKLSATIKSVESEIAALKQDFQQSQAELDRLRREKSEQESGFVSRLSLELSEERNRNKAELSTVKSNYESERRMIVEEHSRSLRKLQNQAAALEYENKDLTEKRHRFEATVQTLTEEKRLQQDELSRLKRELERHREQNNYLGAGNHELDRNLNRLEAKVALLEQEKLRLIEDLSRKEKMIQDLEKQKSYIESDLNEKKLLVTKREDAVKNVSRELLKANDSIKKLHEQTHKLNQKVKLGSDILKEQERVLSGKDEELDSARQELRQQTDSINELQMKIRLLNNEIEDKDKKISDLTKKNKTDEAVIQWLNKQLTFAQSRDPGLRLGPPPDVMSASSPITFNFKDTMLQTPDRSSEKENQDTLGLDPKYLRPMSTSTAVKPAKNSPRLLRRGEPSPQSTTAAGLLRSALQSTTLKSKNQQSVYFTDKR